MLVLSLQECIGRAMLVLAGHIGEENAISMPEFYEQVYGVAPKSRINGTRRLRSLVDRLQRQMKQKICTSRRGRGGYFLARTKEEALKYADALRREALKLMQKSAIFRDNTLIDECGQMMFDLQNGAGAEG